VRPSAVGYGSAADKDEKDARAEVWTPLWSNPTRFEEIRGLLREGRAAVDGRAAQDGMEFAEAAASLGVDRGIKAFVRYNLLRRRGDSYIALPTGKFPVEYRSTADLIRELTPFIDRAGNAAKGSGGEAPNSWPPLKRALEEAMFQALLHSREDLLVEVAASFGAVHRWLLQRKPAVNWPGRLGEGWIKACSKARTEARIAAALAGVWSEDAGELLQNLTPGGTRHAWIGRDLAARMLSTLRRRTMDGAQAERSPFRSSMETRASDAIEFLEGRLDEQLIEDLLFAFVLANRVELESGTRKANSADRWPSYCMLKQLFAAGTHPSSNAPPDEPRFRPDLSIVTLLAANRVADAMSIAIRRFRNVSLAPLIQRGWDSEEGMRLGAALLIPVRDVKWLRRCVVNEPDLKEQEV
jgi:CRISPR-associated protein Csx17